MRDRPTYIGTGEYAAHVYGGLSKCNGVCGLLNIGMGMCNCESSCRRMGHGLCQSTTCALPVHGTINLCVAGVTAVAQVQMKVQRRTQWVVDVYFDCTRCNGQANTLLL